MPVVARAVARILLAGLVAVGCGRGDRSGATGDRQSGENGSVDGTLVRASVLPDSAAAIAFADSLGREGWETTARPRAASDSGWLVSVIVPGDTVLARLVTHALRQSGLDAQVVGPRNASRGIAVAATRVNRGTHGMAARVRWRLSSDRRALLVMEDPRGVENDPLPNGFVFASEGAPLVHRDSVWDAVTSPDWRRVAYSRAYLARAGEADSVPPSEWHRLAGMVGLLESVVRKNAFAISGMVAAFGVARPFVVSISAANDSVPIREDTLPIAEGWRLAWTRDGSRLAIGAPPAVISDDGQPSAWRLVDPATGAARGAGDPASLTRPEWVEGPNLDVSTDVDMKQRRAFRAGDVDVESEDGWIRVYVRDSTNLRASRIVGPGIALTTTANGQFVVAIAADPDATSYNPANHLLVYRIVRR